MEAGSKHISGKTYEVVDASPIADAPEWLLNLVTREPVAQSTPALPIDLPLPTAEIMQAAMAEVVKFAPFIQGQNGRGKMVHCAAILSRDFGLSEESAWPIMVWLNQQASPPFSLEDKSGDNYLKYQLRQGAKHGKHDLGEKREDAALPRTKALIKQFSATARTEVETIDLIRNVREIKFFDPAERKLAEQELSAVTSLPAHALALPSVVRKRDETDRPDVDFITGTNGAPVMNAENVCRVLRYQQRDIWFDEFFQKTLTVKGEWTDAQDLALLVELQSDWGLSRITPNMVHDGVNAYAGGRPKNALRDWLSTLKWDGIPRLDGFCARALGAKDTVYTRAAGANFIRSMIARAYKPGIKVDTMLVLEGKQGSRKSTALQTLASAPFFNDTAIDPRAKDFYVALQGNWLVEISELESFSRSDVTAVKQMLSCGTDTYRAPYGRRAQKWPRQGVFAGTTNETEWQGDETGGRRFWPIECGEIDCDYIAVAREQLFAEAIATISAKGWWTMPAEETALEQEARLKVHGDSWEEFLHDQLVSSNECSTARAYAAIGLTPDRQDKRTQMRLCVAMRKLGFKRDGSRGYGGTWLRVKPLATG